MGTQWDREAARELIGGKAGTSEWFRAVREASPEVQEEVRRWQAERQAAVAAWLRPRPAERMPADCWACGGQSRHDPSCPRRRA